MTKYRTPPLFSPKIIFNKMTQDESITYKMFCIIKKEYANFPLYLGAECSETNNFQTYF